MTQPFPASQMIVGAIFLLCVLTTIAGALIAALTSRIIRSVCGLAMCCIGLAGLYYFLNSPFLALMEILIYVGAVCVTIVFAVMLAEPDEPAREKRSAGTALWFVLALAISAAIFWGIWQLSAHQSYHAPETRITDGSINAIGQSLLTTYSMAFEMISLALLVAIIGALAIARTGRTKAAPNTAAAAARPSAKEQPQPTPASEAAPLAEPVSAK